MLIRSSSLSSCGFMCPAGTKKVHACMSTVGLVCQGALVTQHHMTGRKTRR